MFEMYRSVPRHPVPVTVLMPSIIGSAICQLFVAVCDRFYLALSLNCEASAQYKIGSTICQLFVAVCDRFYLALNLNCEASAQCN